MINPCCVAERWLGGAVCLPFLKAFEIGIVAFFVQLGGEINTFENTVLPFVNGTPDLRCNDISRKLYVI